MNPYERRWDAPLHEKSGEVTGFSNQHYAILAEDNGVHYIHRQLVFPEAKWPSVGDIVQLEYRSTSSGAYWYITQILS